jgi:hypothetical protein
MRTLSRFALMLPLVFAAAVVPVRADHPGGATTADLRELRNEVDRLDDSLFQLDPGAARSAEYQRREEEIRQDLTRLRDQVRRHQQDPNRGLGATKAEVDALRQRIVDLRTDVDRSLGTTSSSTSLRDTSLPDGTEIQVRLANSVSSQTARPEDRVTATVVRSVRSGGRVAIPAGTTVRGVVRDAEPAQRPSKGGRLELAFDSLDMNGERVGIQSSVVSVGKDNLDEKKAGLGAILGGVVGAVIDGKKGAVIGAVVGGGGAVVASKGNNAELPAGTELTLRLDRSVEVSRR